MWNSLNSTWHRSRDKDRQRRRENRQYKETDDTKGESVKIRCRQSWRGVLCSRCDRYRQSHIQIYKHITSKGAYRSPWDTRCTSLVYVTTQEIQTLKHFLTGRMHFLWDYTLWKPLGFEAEHFVPLTSTYSAVQFCIEGAFFLVLLKANPWHLGFLSIFSHNWYLWLYLCSYKNLPWGFELAYVCWHFYGFAAAIGHH